jgi:hypothetical protein
MPVIVPGFVKNGVVVPNTPLPEGAQVDIRVREAPAEVPGGNDSSPVRAETSAGIAQTPADGPPNSGLRLTPAELRKLPREQQEAILAAAAELAEHDYRFDKELTGFEAFSEEELDDDESESRQG